MSQSVAELKLEKQCLLKEINEKLSQIISELKELNELATSNGVFAKDIVEAKQHIIFFKSSLASLQSNSTDTETDKRQNKSSIVQIIEEPVESSSLQLVLESMDTDQ